MMMVMMVMLLSWSVSVDVVSGSNIGSERVRREDLALGVSEWNQKYGPTSLASGW